MATIRPIYIDSASPGWYKEIANTDDFTIGKITFTGVSSVAIDGGGARAENFADPTASNHLATKNYVDNFVAGLDPKGSVRAATTANIVNLAGGAPNTLDGVTLAVNDRVLVKNQTTASQNGVYFVQTLGTGANGTWARATDSDTSAEMSSGVYFWVNEGTTQENSGWLLVTNDPIVLDTTALVFEQFSGLGLITPGAGLTKTGNTLDIGQGDGITVNADDIAVRLAATSGLEFSSGALRLDVDSARGMAIDGTGLYLNLSGTNPGLLFSANALDVKYDSARAITAGAAGIGVNLETSNPGLAITTNKLDAKVAASGGLEKTASGLEVKLVSTDRLSKGASGLDVVGLPTLFEVGGVAVGATVTAANLTDLTDSGSTGLHYHVTTFTASEVMTKGNPVYLTGTPNVVGVALNNNTAKMACIGIADAAAAAAFTVPVAADGAVITGILTGATTGTAYFVGSSVGPPVLFGTIAAGQQVIRVGYAKNATDLFVKIDHVGMKAA